MARREDSTEDIEHRIYYDTIRDIHADWVMTPCAELNDQLPRTVLLQDRARLSGDMSDREHRWQQAQLSETIRELVLFDQQSRNLKKPRFIR